MGRTFEGGLDISLASRGDQLAAQSDDLGACFREVGALQIPIALLAVFPHTPVRSSQLAPRARCWRVEVQWGDPTQ